MRRLPLLRPALVSISAVCLIRGLVLIPLAVRHPELVNSFEVAAAIVWAIAGVGFGVGFHATQATAPELQRSGLKLSR